MNAQEIYQNRIEEAAKKSATTTDGKIISFAYLAAKQMANFILNNLWIPVEEALPDKGHDVLVAILNTKTNTYFYGFDAIVDDSVFLRDKNGFSIEVNYHKITHWMLIPEMKGGE